MQAATQVASIRGHEPLRLSVKPSFANLLVGRRFTSMKTRTMSTLCAWVQMTWFPGARVPKLDLGIHFPGVKPDSQQALDIERFRWFSDDYLTPMENSPRIVDMRYSMSQRSRTHVGDRC